MANWGQHAVDHLAPRIGRITATNAVALAASKMGTTIDTITREDLPGIGENIHSILRVFIGPEAASRLSFEISQLGREAGE
jgi:hypothetical protein